MISVKDMLDSRSKEAQPVGMLVEQTNTRGSNQSKASPSPHYLASDESAVYEFPTPGRNQCQHILKIRVVIKSIEEPKRT